MGIHGISIKFGFDLREDDRWTSLLLYNKALRYRCAQVRWNSPFETVASITVMISDTPTNLCVLNSFWEVDIGTRLCSGFCWSMGEMSGIIEGLF